MHQSNEPGVVNEQSLPRMYPISAGNNTMQTNGQARHFPGTFSSANEGTVIEQRQMSDTREGLQSNSFMASKQAEAHQEFRETSNFVGPAAAHISSQQQLRSNNSRGLLPRDEGPQAKYSSGHGLREDTTELMTAAIEGYVGHYGASNDIHGTNQQYQQQYQ